MTSAFVQTVTGRALVFATPVVEPAHLWSEIAHGLSIVARFSGQTPTPYSVAQHCVLMAEAAEDETGDAALAAGCLLHDGHEAYIGDTPSPMKTALEEEMASLIAAAVPVAATDRIIEANIARWRLARKRIEDRLDAAIFKAAGLAIPDDRTRLLIKRFDLRALVTERRDLMHGVPTSGLPLKGGAKNQPRAWDVDALGAFEPLPLRQGKIRYWPPGVAATRFAAALARLCPHAAAATGRDAFQGAAE